MRIHQVIRQAVVDGNYRFSHHVLERMRQRDVTLMDIKDVLIEGRREKSRDRYEDSQQCWSYAMRGRLEDGRELRVPVREYPGGIIIITAVDLNSEA